jgi:hypothetical protein
MKGTSRCFHAWLVKTLLMERLVERGIQHASLLFSPKLALPIWVKKGQNNHIMKRKCDSLVVFKNGNDDLIISFFQIKNNLLYTNG